MKILICGDRKWISYLEIKKVLNTFDKGTVIVHGCCRGADYIAGVVAKDLGLAVIEVPAEWQKYGKAAGPVRNKKMLDMGVSQVFAFHNNLDESKGTKNMVEQAKSVGIPVVVVKEER